MITDIKTRFIHIINKIYDLLKKADHKLSSLYIYQILIVVLTGIVIGLFFNSYSADRVVKNYFNESVGDIQIVSGSEYNLTFGAKDNRLRTIRFRINPDKTNVKSDDKVHYILTNDQGTVIYQDDAYLFNSDRGYFNLNFDNLKLKVDERYYLKLEFTNMAEESLVALKSHQASSFNKTMEYTVLASNSDDLAEYVDNEIEAEKDLSFDYSIGYTRCANVVYYYSNMNYVSLIIHILFFVVCLGLAFVPKYINSGTFKEIYRFTVVPIYLYLAAEILNIEKARNMSFLFSKSFKQWFCFIVSILIIDAVIFLLYMLIGSGTLSTIFTGVIFGIIAFTNHTKLVMRGDSFMPWDMSNAGIAVKTGSTYYFHITRNFICGIIMLVVSLLLVRIIANGYYKFSKARLLMIANSVLIGVLIFMGTVFNTTLLDKLKVYYEIYPPIQSFNENGTYMAFFMLMNNMGSRGGDNNSPENTENLVMQYRGIAASDDLDDRVNNSEVKPNVICIMSEAYTDLSDIRNFSTSEPVMPYYNRLMNESMHGDLAVSIFGGGTCNTEFEFLTGYSMSYLLPGSSVYSYYVKNDIEALPNIYRDNGYRTVALHSFDGEWWERAEKYPLLGFDQFYSRDDFDVDPSEYCRRYISDLSTFEKITDIYEESEDPLFLFCVTMQNHADFSEHYPNMKYDIQITDPINENGSDYTYAENYLSLLRESDDALRYLIEYLKDSDEPTIVVFFGDHCPTLGDGFYDFLLQKSLGSVTLEESIDIYETKYFVWANYDLSEGGTSIDTSYGNKGVISPNFLGQNILDLSGLDSPDSRACLRVLNEHISALSAVAVYDNNGQPHFENEGLPESTIDILNDYSSIQYGLVYYSDYSPADSEN